jgi:hypothetical protein
VPDLGNALDSRHPQLGTWRVRIVGFEFQCVPRRIGRRSILLLLLVLAVFFAPPRSVAADTNTVADIQCVVIGIRLSASSVEMQRRSGEMLLLYFLGRVQGRSPTIDLQGLMRNEANKMTSSQIDHATRRCGEELSTLGKQISEIGRRAVEGGN